MKVMHALPEYTGCRWYDPDNRPVENARRKGFFNHGRYISGPDFYLKLSDLMPESTPATLHDAGTSATPVGTPADTRSDSVMEIATDSEAPAPERSSASPSSLTSIAARDSNIKDSINPLKESSSANTEEVSPTVPVQNRFSILQSPKLHARVPTPAHQEVRDTVSESLDSSK